MYIFLSLPVNWKLIFLHLNDKLLIIHDLMWIYFNMYSILCIFLFFKKCSFTSLFFLLFFFLLFYCVLFAPLCLLSHSQLTSYYIWLSPVNLSFAYIYKPSWVVGGINVRGSDKGRLSVSVILYIFSSQPYSSNSYIEKLSSAFNYYIIIIFEQSDKVCKNIFVKFIDYIQIKQNITQQNLWYCLITYW